MDRITLTALPFPQGEIPRLMPFQEFPFNGDGYAAAKVLQLKEKWNLTTAIETGTCLGSTTAFFCEHFEAVYTSEINKQYHAIASKRLEDTQAEPWHGDSVDALLFQLEHCSRPFIFLDAHWGQHCPLLDELSAISMYDHRPVIMIHDFQVPGKDFGFDRFPDTGNPFSIQAIKTYLALIYPDGYSFSYNEDAEGAKRGIIYVEPK